MADRIIVNLLMMADFYDVAFRNFGLVLAALTLARLATAFSSSPCRAGDERRGAHGLIMPLQGVSLAAFDESFEGVLAALDAKVSADVRT